MTTHLAGRMPHGDLASLLDRVQKMKQPSPSGPDEADKGVIADRLANEIGHIARTFVQVVADFRSTLPRSEEKQQFLRHKQKNKTNDKNQEKSLRPRQPQPQPETWRPFENAFDGVDLLDQEILLQRGPPLPFFKGGCEGSGYRPEWSAACSLIVHNRLEPLRQMVDSGVDLRMFNRQAGHVGGGLLFMSYDNVPLYLWINQLLLNGYPLPTRQEKLQERHEQPSQSNKQTPSLRNLIIKHACRSLQTALDDHDCMEYRVNINSQHLRKYVTQHVFCCNVDDNESIKPPPSTEELYEYIKSHAFPQLYRTSHVYLYNKVWHQQQQQKVDKITITARLEDPKGRTLFDYEVQGKVVETIHSIVGELQPWLKNPLYQALHDKRLLSHWLYCDDDFRKQELGDY